MQQKIFAVRDSKAEFFSAPFFKRTHGEAERDFQAVANDPQSTVGQFPEDFSLFYIGEFDNITGKIQGIDQPQHLAHALTMKSTLKSVPVTDDKTMQ